MEWLAFLYILQLCSLFFAVRERSLRCCCCAISNDIINFWITWKGEKEVSNGGGCSGGSSTICWKFETFHYSLLRISFLITTTISCSFCVFFFLKEELDTTHGVTHTYIYIYRSAVWYYCGVNSLPPPSLCPPLLIAKSFLPLSTALTLKNIKREWTAFVDQQLKWHRAKLPFFILRKKCQLTDVKTEKEG